jgi:hypothetical protein
MSAGTGIFTASTIKIKISWLFTDLIIQIKKCNACYDQILDLNDRHNKLQILSPNPEDEGVWIHQDAWFHIGKFDTILLHMN